MDVPPPTRPPPRRPDAPETTPPNARPLPSPQGRPLPTPGTPVGGRPLPTPGDPSTSRPLPNPQGRPLPTPGTPVGNRPLPSPGANQRPLPSTNGVPPMRGGIPRGGSVRMPREGSQPNLEQPFAPPKGGSFRMPRGGSQPSLQTPITPPPPSNEEEVYFEEEISKPPVQTPPKPPAKQLSQTTIEQTQPPTPPVKQQSQPQFQPQPVLPTKPQEQPQKANSISQRIQSFKGNSQNNVQSYGETSNTTTNLRSPSTPKLPDRSPENARKKTVVKGPPCPWREPLADESPKQLPPIVSPRNNLPPSLPPKQTSSIEITNSQLPPILSPRNNHPPSLPPKQYSSSSSLELPPRSPEGSRRSLFIQGPDLPWREPLPQANTNNNNIQNNNNNNNNAPPVAQNKPQRQPTLGQQMSNLFSPKAVESNPPPLDNVPSIDLTRMKFGLSDEDIKKPPKEQLSILSNQINTINQKIQDLLKERRRIESTNQNQNLVKDMIELENYYDAENIRICNQITAIQKIFEADIAKLSDPNLENTPKPPLNRRGSILVSTGEQSTFVICTQEYIPWHTDQLSIKNGDIIKVLQKFPTSWWKGELNKVVGFFPLNHTQPFSQSAPVYVNSIQRPVETPSTSSSSSSSSSQHDEKKAPTLTEFLTSPRKADPQPQPPPQPQPQSQPQPQVQPKPQLQPQIQIQPQPQVQVQMQAQPVQAQPQPRPIQSSQTPLQLPAYAQSRPQSQQQIPVPVQSKPTPPQPSNPAPQPAGEYVIALYDIPQPSYPNQLTLKKGDIIRLVDNNDQTWWKGELNGKEGFFPSNFVQTYSYANPLPVPAPVGVQRAKVLFGYTGRSESEATVTVGSIVQVEKVEGPWTLVNTNGESGFIPSSYLELL